MESKEVNNKKWDWQQKTDKYIAVSGQVILMLLKENQDLGLRLDELEKNAALYSRKYYWFALGWFASGTTSLLINIFV